MTSYPQPTTLRATEISTSLSEIRSRVAAVSKSNPTLVAVSKLKPASDIMACYDLGHRDFGENYISELVEKARELPEDIRWHFIGTLQSNKAKIAAGVPNLHTLQTLTSAKSASILNKSLPEDRSTQLNVMIQINTSGEDSKSGLDPLPSSGSVPGHVVWTLAQHVLEECPRLHLLGLMTIGSFSESISASPNRDFITLTQTKHVLEEALGKEGKFAGKWGEDGGLVLSMGMSSDFEAALKAGSGIVRVGTGIFGERPTKT